MTDEFKNDLNVRNETIIELESKLQAYNGFHVQQSSYPWPPNPYWYDPRFPSPTPYFWSQEYHHINQFLVAPPYLCHPTESITHDLSCPQPFPDATAAPHPEERLQDDRAQLLPDSHLSPTVDPAADKTFTQKTHNEATVREELLQDSPIDLTVNSPFDPSAH